MKTVFLLMFLTPAGAFTVPNDPAMEFKSRKECESTAYIVHNLEVAKEWRLSRKTMAYCLRIEK